MKPHSPRNGRTRSASTPKAKPPKPPPPPAHPHVVISPDGCPHVHGSRGTVTVHLLWAWHRTGAPIADIIQRFPDLGPAPILDALSFAYDHEQLVEGLVARDPQRNALGSHAFQQLELPFPKT